MPDRAKLEALLERVENASGPDREIDAEIARAFGFDMWSVCLGDWLYGKPWREHMRPDERGADTDEQLDAPFRWFVRIDQAGLLVGEDLPAYTASVDAALELAEGVLPGCWIEISGPRKSINIPRPVPNFWKCSLDDFSKNECSHVGWAATLPLSLCAAIIRAALAGDAQ